MLEQLGRLGVAAPQELNLVGVGFGLGLALGLALGLGLGLGLGSGLGHIVDLGCGDGVEHGADELPRGEEDAGRAHLDARGLTARLQPGYVGLQPERIGLQLGLQRAAHQQRRPQTLRVVLLWRRKKDARGSLGRAPGGAAAASLRHLHSAGLRLPCRGPASLWPRG